MITSYSIVFDFFVVEMTFERHLMLHIQKQRELVVLDYLIDELQRIFDRRLKNIIKTKRTLFAMRFLFQNNIQYFIPNNE